MRSLVTVAILATLLVLSGCTADTTPHLTFATHLSVSANGETVVIGEVRNAGYAPLRSLGVLEGVLQVRDEAGTLVVCTAVPEFTGSVMPGDSDFPLRWRARLEPGDYTLTWGAPAHGGIRADFALGANESGLRLERGRTVKLTGAAAAISPCDATGSLPSSRAQ